MWYKIIKLIYLFWWWLNHLNKTYSIINTYRTRNLYGGHILLKCDVKLIIISMTTIFFLFFPFFSLVDFFFFFFFYGANWCWWFFSFIVLRFDRLIQVFDSSHFPVRPYYTYFDDSCFSLENKHYYIKWHKNHQPILFCIYTYCIPMLLGKMETFYSRYHSYFFISIICVIFDGWWMPI